MISVHPSILEKDGIKEFAVLPYNEFLKIREELEDYEDLKLLRQAKLEEAYSKAAAIWFTLSSGYSDMIFPTV
jgi:hypothetical protein